MMPLVHCLIIFGEKSVSFPIKKNKLAGWIKVTLSQNLPEAWIWIIWGLTVSVVDLLERLLRTELYWYREYIYMPLYLIRKMDKYRSKVRLFMAVISINPVIFKMVPWPLTSRYVNENGSVCTHKSPLCIHTHFMIFTFSLRSVDNKGLYHLSQEQKCSPANHRKMQFLQNLQSFWYEMTAGMILKYSSWSA